MRLILASGSRQRLDLLTQAGLQAEVVVPRIDDSALDGVHPEPANFTLALAWFKAAQVASTLQASGGPTLILAADTTCVINGRIETKPRDADDARRMVRAMSNREHEVWTAVAMLQIPAGERVVWCDCARVHLGALSSDELERYVASGDWRGRAGGYNYTARHAAGWPLRCDGDPTTVTGLPMKRLIPWLARLGVHS